jgi:hypothetical protein
MLIVAFPITVTPFSSPPPNTVVPSLLEAKWALQCRLMVVEAITFTLEIRQYQPLGFIKVMLDPVMILTFGWINTSSGFSVGTDSLMSSPIPKILNFPETDLKEGLFASKGWSGQEAKQTRTASRLAEANVGDRRMQSRMKRKGIRFMVSTPCFGPIDKIVITRFLSQAAAQKPPGLAYKTLKMESNSEQTHLPVDRIGRSYHLSSDEPNPSPHIDQAK